MLFNSAAFIFLFLPAVFFSYLFLIQRKLISLAKVCLIGSSLFFYAWWKISYLPILLGSIFINYYLGIELAKKQTKSNFKTVVFVAGLIFNVALLFFFKYTNFFIENLNHIFSFELQSLVLALPLAISFFTFQQISFLFSVYKGEVKLSEIRFFDYTLFVSFFPQLIAGPIVSYSEMIPQIKNIKNWVINYQNISLGLLVFSLGLFKKVAIADNLAFWANWGFDYSSKLDFFEAWLTSLSYTFQLYFDFSGYADMAIGLGLIFNIKIPENFNSPYKAANIRDFWRRWHITLGRFIKNCIYIPLGGNRLGNTRTCMNLLITFLLVGLWHGAAWGFILWGFLHGIALVVHRIWSNSDARMNTLLAWGLNFLFVNFAWVVFRATDLSNAMKVYKGMLDFESFSLDFKFLNINAGIEVLVFVGFTIFLIFFCNKSKTIREQFKPNWSNSFNIIFLFYVSWILMFLQGLSTEFLYFNF